MKTTSHGKPFRTGFLFFCVTLFLIAAMLRPAAATVFPNITPIPISSAFAGTGSPYPSDIPVSNLGGKITDIRVTLHNFNHTYPDDLDILLVGPLRSNNIILMSDAGGDGDRYNIDLIFDDDDILGVSLPDSATLPSGIVRPTNFEPDDAFRAPAPDPSANTSLLTTFRGTEPNGTWSLYVVDDRAVDIGVIGNGWSLTITTDVNTAATFDNHNMPIHGGEGEGSRASLYASTIDVDNMAGAITDVNVTLSGITHDNPDDIDVLLVGPSGKRILLLSDAGGSMPVSGPGINMTFDDAAGGMAPDTGPFVTGSVKPTNFGLMDTLPDLSEIYPSPPPAGAATLASVFNGTEPNGKWKLYVVDDALPLVGTIAAGWSIDITAGGIHGASRFTNSDFDGDGLSDTAVFNPIDSIWHLRDSSSTNKRSILYLQPGDIPVPGDYDADGKTDFGIYRPGSSSRWIIELSGGDDPIDEILGTSEDIPIPQDYDGNGKTDIAVFKPSGKWKVGGRSDLDVDWGQSGDLPVRGHFFGTDRADYAVFRPSEGIWFILRNDIFAAVAIHWGLGTDHPVPGDYDGDSITDTAVYRPSSSDWYIRLSSSESMYVLHHGSPGDIPVPGDYDGDKRTDIAVWSPGSGAWYIYESGTPFGAGALKLDIHGDPDDVPIAKYYLP